MSDELNNPEERADAYRDVEITAEMEQAFIDYAMSVIVSRALPDVRDGLKPVQRRIIYSMFEQNIGPGTSHRKCSKVVGDVMGNYHPHGDQAIYDALVRMGQDFSMRHPLIDPQGNFGTIDDPAGAMRYCVTGDTRIRTAEGTVRIDEIADAAPNSEVDIDLKVLDRLGDPVRATKLIHSGVQPTLRLRTREGFELQGTPNHPVLCLVEVLGVPMLSWKLLSELRPDDVVCIARSEGDGGGGEDPALGLLAGALVSEGWMSEDRAGFNNTDRELFRMVVAAYDHVVGGRRYVATRTLPSGKTLWELDIHDTSALAASPLADLMGQRSDAKRVPEAVWRSGPGTKRSFLQALFEGDGSCSRLARNTVHLAYSTRSEELAKDVQLLLTEFGIIAKRYRNRRGEVVLTIGGRHNVHRFGTRVGFLTAKQAKLAGIYDELPEYRGKSADRIPFIADYLRQEASRGHREWLAKHELSSWERWHTGGDELLRRVGNPEAEATVRPILESGYYFARVGSVTPAGLQPVYSIRVDSEDHAFLAGGFVNHNTEARLAPLAMSLLDGIREDTVDFAENYSGELMEPTVLPARFPNLLVNGSQGIAVGMATNIPPHNLGEVIDACVHMLEHPDADATELMQFIKGPDFPTGGFIVGAGGIRDALTTGRGSVKMRAAADVQEVRKGRTAIVVTELPYQVSIERVMAKIKQLVDDKKIQGIADLRNESSSRVGMRLIIELKQGAVPQVVLNQLYKNTPLQDSFGYNMVSLVDGVPLTLNLAHMIGHYLDHQMEVIERRTRFRLEQAEARAHIVEGLIIAVDNIDEVIRIIRGSDDTPAARSALMERFELSEIQANAILDMPLRRLTALEVSKLREELEELQALIAELQAILADPARRRALIRDELVGIREKYAEPRRTRIVPDEGELSLEDLIADDEIIVTVSQTGYVKSVPANTYRTQGRGGRGIRAAELSEDDVIAHLLHTTAHAYLLFFTNTGRVHRIKAHEIPRQSRTSRGVLAHSVLPLEADERIQSVIDTRDYETNRYLVMVTERGQVKKTEFKEYDSRHQTLIAINLTEGDELVGVRTTNGSADLLLFTENGMGIRFSEEDLRPMGRNTQGVRGIKLRDGDRVVALASSHEGEEVLLLTSGGYGKRTALEQFPRQGRGGVGVKAFKLTRVRGRLVGARAVDKDTEAFLISSSGIGIRTRLGTISRQGRQATGVKVMDVGDGELSAFTIVRAEDAD